MQLEQERLGREREKTEEEIVAHFQRWLKNPAVRDLVCQNYLTPEEREQRMRELFGVSPEPSADPVSEAGSNLVKPSQTKKMKNEPRPAGFVIGLSPQKSLQDLRAMSKVSHWELKSNGIIRMLLNFCRFPVKTNQTSQ